MHPRLVRNAIYPLMEWRTGSRVREILSDLEQSQWFPPERLREIQWTKLRALLTHAVATVPYYRRLFADLGARPEEFQSLDDLRQLPVLTKQGVRDCGRELIAEGAGKLYRRVTSGSTGIPLQTYGDARARDWLYGAVRRWRRWWGIEVGDRIARLTTADPAGRQRVRLSLLNEHMFSCVDLSEAAMADLYRRLCRFRPAALRGNPHTLAHFAHYVQEHHAGANALRPEVILCSAETLYAHQRALLARVFACPVGNAYGANELGLIAMECPQGGMHIVAESFVLEYLPATSDGRGSTEMVVTGLDNWGMPLLRYAVGDLGAPLADRCPCGRGLPLLDLKAGRTGDLVVLPGGRYMDHSVLCAVFEDLGLGKVRQYQITQEALERFTVVVATDRDDGVSDAIRRGFRQILGAGPSVTVRVVAEIPRESSGKLRLFISNVGQAADGQPRESTLVPR